MPKKPQRSKNRIFSALLLFSAFMLSACSEGETVYIQPEATIAPVQQVDTSIDAEKIRISELMAKNRCSLRDEDGNFPDWIELENCSDERVSLAGWRLSDEENDEGWQLPNVELQAGARLVVYADGKDDGLHADFSLSEGESVYLYNAYGHPASTAAVRSAEADIASVLNAQGKFEESLYPTPGYPNETEYYELWQNSILSPGPLQINRVAVANQSAELYGADWVEIKNISSAEVELSDYYLSDDNDDYKLWNFPKYSLSAGESLIVCCDDVLSDSSLIIADFALNSSNEQLYLSNSNLELIDYVSLKNIPYDCSYGRLEGEEGWFYFYGSNPYERSEKGYRRVSETPKALSVDGVYNNVDSVEVSITGKGRIYYSTDSSLPTENSMRYEGSFSVGETCIVRAISVEDGAMPSRALTLSYIINENHSLPVVSLVSNDSEALNSMYNNAVKNLELPGSVSLYDEQNGFTINCGIKMHGDTSLKLGKKNMSLRFRGAYGQEELNYDVYGGGVTKFTNFVLRAGQDYHHAIIRNELGQNLALASSDSLVTQRSKYCILYVDGEYRGIYNLMEKANEQHYANLAGVSRESVTVEEAIFSNDSLLYKEVFRFCQENDMSKPENYEYICSVLDIDSLIDWIILEGFCANTDLHSGNVRYCRSMENDGKWRMMFYDLDASFVSYALNFNNVLAEFPERRYSALIQPLLDNAEFKDKLLSRTAELLSTTLSTENVLAEIDRLSAMIAPEVERDYARFHKNYTEWTRSLETLRDFFRIWKWTEHNVDAISNVLKLSPAETEHYFGELLK